MISAFIEVTLAVMINMNDIRYDTYGNYISQVFMCLFLLIFIVYPFWVYFFLRYNYDNLEEDEIKEKYSSLYWNV